MNIIDAIIVTVIVGAVAAIIIKKIKDKKAGKSGCGCDCTGCSESKHCH